MWWERMWPWPIQWRYADIDTKNITKNPVGDKLTCKWNDDMYIAIATFAICVLSEIMPHSIKHNGKL
jgi:hypothetical protein